MSQPEPEPRCVEPGELQAFVAGTLDPAAGERVEAHIDDCADCRAVLAAIARSSLAASLSDTPATDETLPAGPGNAATLAPIKPAADSKVVPGALVDRYVVLRTLGRGGMGVVVLARDPELRRKLVIKLVRPEMVDPGDTQGTRVRLLREAQAMAQVSHPNVVPVYDVGTHAGQVFIAMEFIDGHNLAEWLADEERPLADIVDRFVAAGRGLAAAHAAGLIHRDFKPQNVMIGRTGTVKVTDFGLARAELPTRSQGARLSRERPAVRPPPEELPEREAHPRREPGGADSSGATMQSPLTRTGALVGTPAYMAPEQMLSDFVDHRSDQFSFCVALWQAVYGVRPFAGESVTAILESTLKGKLAEPTRAPRLPRRVRDALLRGLSAEPEDRFPSIEALLAELAPPARRPWLIAGGVAAIAAAAVATAIAVSRPERAAVPATAICTGSERELADVWSDASHARLANAVAAAKLPRPDETTAALTSALDRYAAQWSAMHVDNCEATRVRKQQTDDIMAKRLACLDRRRVELRLAAALALAIHDVESMKLAQGQIAALPQIEMCTVARMDEELIAPTNETADALVAIQRTRLTEADFYASQRKLDQAEAIAHTVIEEARKIPYPPLEAEGLIKLGQIQMYGLRWDEAATSMTEAVQVADLARHHRAKGEAQLALIQILRRLGRTEEAERYRRYAQNSLASAGSIDQSEIDLARSLAQTFLHQGAVEEAIGQHRRILELTESLHGKDSVEVAKVAAEMAAVLMNAAERYADAVPLLERATAIYDNQPGMGKLEGLTTRFQRQVALHFTGRFADAVAAGQDVIARAGADSLWASAVWSFTGMSQIELGQVEEAHASARRALALTEKQLGKESVSYANTYMLEAQLYARVEDYASAERVMREARTMIVPLVPADDPQLATVDNAIASMMAKQGRAAGAIVMFEATLAALARQADPNVPDIARTYSRLATALLAANQPQRAVDAANQALERWHNNLAPPGEIASAKFTLARGLWLSNRDRPRALVLAEEARALYADTIEEPRRVEIERWLADKRR